MTTDHAPVAATRPSYNYSLLLRITHWLNVPLMILMMASGIQIWWAYPAFGPNRPNPEALYRTLSGVGRAAPAGEEQAADIRSPVDPEGILLGSDYREFVQWLSSTFGLGGWLAGALRWHFAVMWPYALNGLAYLLLLLMTDEGRHYRLRWSDVGGVAQMLRHPLRTFFQPPGEGKFNPLQKIAYNLVIVAGILSILTGLAIYKPVQLGWLTGTFGGYQASRFLHFLVMLFLVAFTLGHLVMVFSHGWRRGLAPMIVGVKAEREAFRLRQRAFARGSFRLLAEAVLLALCWWLGGAIASLLNGLFGGNAPAWIFRLLIYVIVRLGPVRARDRRKREARLRRMEITA